MEPGYIVAIILGGILVCGIAIYLIVRLTNKQREIARIADHTKASTDAFMKNTDWDVGNIETNESSMNIYNEVQNQEEQRVLRQNEEKMKAEYAAQIKSNWILAATET